MMFLWYYGHEFDFNQYGVHANRPGLKTKDPKYSLMTQQYLHQFVL